MIVPARLKPGTEGWSRFFYPTPTHENITACVSKYSESDKAKEAVFLFDVFRHSPENKTRETVTRKVEALLDYMVPHVDIHQNDIIRHILSDKDFDRKLQRGVKSIVNKIADTSRAKEKYDAFARYYCSFHNPQHYLPGLGIKSALWEYEKLDHFLQGEKFYWGDRYTPYVKQFEKFVDFYGLQDYSAWHLHIFLWQLGREELHVREHRFPCKEAMRGSSNSYNLSIIKAANQRNED